MPENARTRLLEAAVDVIRAKGLHATSVDELCAAAGVTKGAFFHHFRSKDDLAVAAAGHWSDTTGALFAAAAYHALDDPLDRVLGYLDLRAGLVAGPPERWTCLVGTMAQETFLTVPAVRDACGASILGHAATLEADLAAAVDRHAPGAGLDPAALARHTQVVLQGAFVVSKATGDPAVALEAIEHLRSYLTLLLRSHQPEGATR